MEEFLLFFLSVFVLFILIGKLFKNKEILHIKSNLDGREYIVRKLPDAVQAADKLAGLNSKILTLIGSLSTDEKDGIDDLKSNYNPDSLSETGIDAKYTSYSVNKGEKISICLRNKEDNSFIDDNTILFVFIHELAHVMTDEIGHTPLFWENMAFLLKKANSLNIYIPINYKETPQRYCGMDINSTPYEF
mgnify:FL=1|tara:strand:+ start:203 stop:772 length:570 start_codon:yes stop_codon:yes gene_type:complete